MFLDRKYRDIRRTRKIYKTLHLPENGNLIDVSCGGGRLLKTIENNHPNLKLFGVDITPGFLAMHPELSNITFAAAEADVLPYENEMFDVAICSLSMHHYKNLVGVLTEIVRVTKANGQIYLIDIIPGSNFSQSIYNFIRCREPYHFEKFYTQENLTTLLKEFGCEIIGYQGVTKIPRVLTLRIRKKPTS